MVLYFLLFKEPGAVNPEPGSRNLKIFRLLFTLFLLSYALCDASLLSVYIHDEE
jgi:hypothetical protein